MAEVEEQVITEVQQQPDPVALSNTFVVDSLEARAKAEEYVGALDALLKNALSRFEPIREKAYAAYMESLNQKKSACEPLESAKRLFLRRIADYDIQQTRLAQRAEIAAREAAAREHQAFVEAQLTEAGNSGPVSDPEITAIICQPPPPPPIAVYAPPCRSAVAPPRTVYSAQIENAKAVLEEIVAGRIPWQEAIEFKMSYFNNRARADKDHLRIPGVRVVTSNATSYRPKGR